MPNSQTTGLCPHGNHEPTCKACRHEDVLQEARLGTDCDLALARLQQCEFLRDKNESRKPVGSSTSKRNRTPDDRRRKSPRWRRISDPRVIDNYVASAIDGKRRFRDANWEAT